MNAIKPIDISAIEQALTGQMDQPAVQGLIERLQSRLDDLLPTANRAFANVATEAFDLTQGSASLGLADALKNISSLQAEIDAILYQDETQSLQAMAADMLPSPEMLFSDPDHVPRFVDWTSQQSNAPQAEVPLHIGLQNGISSNSSLLGFDVNGDRFDA